MTLRHILTAALLLPTALALPGVADAVAQQGPAGVSAPEHSPRIALWTNRRDDLFQRGDPMTVFLRTDVDAYVTLLRVDADGGVRVLFPRGPFDDAFVRGGADVRVSGPRAEYTLRVDEYPGEGFLFALVTLDPIGFAAFSRGREWDYAALGLPARVTDDPYVLFSAVLAALVPETYEEYGYVVAPYYVDEQHGYPKFLCYQCHAYVSPAIWDPYAHTCIRVRVAEPVWWRYPGDYYGGVAVVPPARALPPRYVVETRPPPSTGPRDRATPTGRAAGGRRPAPVVASPAPTRRPAPTARDVPPTARRGETAKATARRPAPKPGTAKAAPAPTARRETPKASAAPKQASRGSAGSRGPARTRGRRQ